MKRLLMLFSLVAMMLSATSSQGALLLFEAQLTGAEEVPPTGSPGTGFGTVRLDDVALTIDVDLTFNGLTAPSTAAHIHEGDFAQLGPIEFPLSLGAALGQQSGTIPHQSFPLLEGDEDVEEFLAEGYYFNVHSSAFPDGEIRGQIRLARVIPEPEALLLIAAVGLGLVVTDLTRRARRT